MTTYASPRRKDAAYTADGLKVCWQCHIPQEPTRDNFSPDGTRPDGFKSQCRSCKRAMDRASKRRQRGSAIPLDAPPHFVMQDLSLPPGHKRCATCHLILSATRAVFHRSKGGRFGFSNECILCTSARHRRWCETCTSEQRQARIDAKRVARRQGALTRIDLIVRLCADEWDTPSDPLRRVTPALILGTERMAHVVLARDAVIRLVRARFCRTFTWEQLSVILHRDHSSLLASYKRSQRRMRREHGYRDALERVRVAYAARVRPRVVTKIKHGARRRPITIPRDGRVLRTGPVYWAEEGTAWAS